MSELPPEYRAETKDSFVAVNIDDWIEVYFQDGNPFCSPEFIRTVERSLIDPGKFWFTIYYDEQDSPVACVCYSLFDVDGAILAPGWLQSTVRGIRKLFSRFFKFRLLLGGLPPSVSGHNIATNPDVDWERLCRSMASTAQELAKREKAVLISFKEFDQSMTEKLSSLVSLGFHRGDSIVTYVLEEDCQTFDEYYESRSKRTRANMRKYFRHLEEAGITWETRAGAEEIESLYSEDVHQLYESVFEHAEVKFEHVPPEFFREIARQFPEASRFTLFRQDGAIVGFCVGLIGDEFYHLMYCGFDYEINQNTNLYFNILYRGVEDGYNQSRSRMHIGGAADEFKRRMGARGEVLSVFVKGVGPVMGPLFRLVAPKMFPDLSEGAH